MVLSLGLSPSVFTQYENTLVGSHRVRVQVELLDLNHNLVDDLSGLRTEGSVQISVGDNSGPTRSASLSLFDPTDLLDLDNAATTTAGANRLFKISRGVYVGSRWVDVPIIVGPLNRASRQGDVLALEIQDKTALMLDEGRSFTVKKGTNIATAMRQIASKFGEKRVRIANSTKKTGKDRVIGKDFSPWQALNSLASALGWALFYSADGYLTARPRSSTPVFTFAAGTGGTLLGGIQIGYRQEDMVNRVIVRGGIISKTQIVAVATVNVNHPLSPEKLARGGEPQYWTHQVEDTAISTFKAAAERAEDTLEALSTHANTASYESLVIPHLEPHDLVTVIDPQTGVQTSHRFREATIPLTADGSMSVGYNSRTTRSRLRERITPKSRQLKRAERNAARAKAKARAQARAKKRAAAKRKAAAAKKRRKK